MAAVAALAIGLAGVAAGFGLAAGALSSFLHRSPLTGGVIDQPATTGQDVPSVASGVTPAVVDITTTLVGGVAAGTGMVVGPGGEVLTNNHVIQGATSIHVQIGGSGPVRTASVVGDDEADDIALIRVDGVSGLRTAPLGDSSTVTVGDPVVAMGNALGQGGPPAVSEGAVTGLGRSIEAGDDTGSSETLSGLIQIDAPIQPGDSGGPLIDRNGRVVGMNTAADIGFRRRTASRVAFAIPINHARTIADEIRSGHGGPNVHTGPTAFLGIGVQTAPDGGALVGEVQSGGPAQAAGIVPGDVITAVGGREITSPSSLGPAIRSHRPGDRVQVTWIDVSGRRHTASVRLGSGPPG